MLGICLKYSRERAEVVGELLQCQVFYAPIQSVMIDRSAISNIHPNRKLNLYYYYLLRHNSLDPYDQMVGQPGRTVLANYFGRYYQWG